MDDISGVMSRVSDNLDPTNGDDYEVMYIYNGIRMSDRELVGEIHNVIELIVFDSYIENVEF